MQREPRDCIMSKDRVQEEFEELLHDFDASLYENELLRQDNQNLKGLNQNLLTEMEKILEERDILANDLEKQTEKALSLEPTHLKIALRNQKEEMIRRISILNAERIGLENLVQNLYRERDVMDDQLLAYAKKIETLENRLRKTSMEHSEACKRSEYPSSIPEKNEATAIRGLKKPVSMAFAQGANRHGVRLEKSDDIKMSESRRSVPDHKQSTAIHGLRKSVSMVFDQGGKQEALKRNRSLAGVVPCEKRVSVVRSRSLGLGPFIDDKFTTVPSYQKRDVTTDSRRNDTFDSQRGPFSSLLDKFPKMKPMNHFGNDENHSDVSSRPHWHVDLTEIDPEPPSRVAETFEELTGAIDKLGVTWHGNRENIKDSIRNLLKSSNANPGN